MAWQGAWEAFEAAGTFAQQALAATEVAEDMFDAAGAAAKKINNELGSGPATNIASYLGKRKFTGDSTNPSIRGPPKIHRRIEPLPQTTSQSNMPQSSGDHQDEVAVMPHHGPMSKIVEDYHTIKLNYFNFATDTTGALFQNNFIDRVFRFNSIYDVNESEVGTQSPLGRDTWASIYQYYRVLSCDVEIKLINRDQKDTMLAGLVLEEDDLNLTTDIRNFMMRKNVIRAVVPGYAVGGSGLGIIRYHYNPSNWDHHVQETGIEERWTPIGQSPANNHRGILRLTPLRAADVAGRVLDYEYQIQMKYTVQFREANKTILTSGNLPS